MDLSVLPSKCRANLGKQSDLFMLFPLVFLLVLWHSLIIKGTVLLRETEKQNRMQDKTIVQISSHLEMVGFIKANGTQCRFVSMVSDTPVTKLRKGCPFVGVRKVSRKNGLINANYNTAVRKRIAERLGVELKEVEYENGEVWYRHEMTQGENPKPLPLVVNKTKNDGKVYLQYYPHKSTHTYVLPNGETVTEAQLEPYFYKQSPRPDFKPCVISVDIANIKELRASGIIMQTEDIDEAETLLAK